jgi:hypothetical protein
MAIFGLVQDDSADDDASAPAPRRQQNICYLWPCNLRTFNLWMQVQTQWRTSATGSKTGLDYAGVEAWMRSQRILRPSARAEAMRCLQAMEIASINAWAQQRQDNP